MNRKIFLTSVFFILIFGGVIGAADPAVTLVEPNGVDGNYLAGNQAIVFNVQDQDIESNADGNLFIDIYYSTSAGLFFNSIVSDGNLFDTTTFTCEDTDFSNQTQCSYIWDTTTPSDGNYFIDLNTHDDSDANASSSSDSSFMIDNSAPTTTVTGYNAGWQTTDQNIVLSCSDGSGSGCSNIKYRIGSGAWLVFDQNILFTDGNHQLDYLSEDRTGNSETTQTVRISIDKTAPTTTDNAPSGWQTNDFTITLTCSDPETVSDGNSGCSLTKYKVNNGGWNTGTSINISDDGNHKIEYYSKDVAGNEEGHHTTYAALYGAAPHTTDNAPTGWQNANQTITLTVTGGTSGIANTYYCVDTGNSCDPNTSGTSVEVTCSDNSECQKYIRYYSEDNAGIKESTNSVLVKIEKKDPNKPGDFSLELQADGDIEISWDKPSDNGPSGIDKYVIVREDEGESLDKSDYDEKFTVNNSDTESYVDDEVSEGKSYCYRMYAVDNAGNESSLTNKKCQQTKEPNISIDLPEYAKAEKVRIDIRATDEKMDDCQLSVKPSNESSYEGISGLIDNTYSSTRYYTFTTKHHGTAEFKLECDNLEDAVEAFLKVDTEKPVVSWLKPVAGSKLKGTVELQVEVDDGHGYGMKEVLFYYNGTKISRVTKATNGKYKASWSTASASGKVTLKAKAVDNAGNSTEEPLSVTVEETEKEEEKEDPKKRAEDAIALGEKEKKKVEALAKEFEDLGLPLLEEMSSLKKQADSLLISSKSLLSKKNYSEAEQNAVKATGKFTEFTQRYSAPTEFYSKEFSFENQELGVLVDSIVFEGELAEKAKNNLMDANAQREIKVFKAMDENKEKYLITIELTLINNSDKNALQIVEFIPKELAKSSDAIASQLPFEVLESDPIIKFTVEGIEKGKTAEVNYYLKDSLSKTEIEEMNAAGGFTSCNKPPLPFKAETTIETAVFSPQKEKETAAGLFSLGNLLPWLGLIIVAVLVAFVAYQFITSRETPEEESMTALSGAIHKTHESKKPGFLERFGGKKEEEKESRWKYRSE